MSRNLEERERETTTMAPAMQKKACTGGVWFLAASQLLGFGKAIIIRGGAGCRFSPAHIWTITLGKEESTLIGKTRSRKTGFYVHLHARKKIPRMVLLILFYSVQPIADECVVLL